MKALAILLCAMVALLDAAPAHAAEKARAAKEKVAEPMREDAVALGQRYQRLVNDALSQQLCLVSRGCVTDEARMIRALEESRTLLSRLEQMASSGDIEAAYQRGRIAHEQSRRQGERAMSQTDATFWAEATILRKRADDEARVADRFLSLASADGHPDACFLLAGTLAGSRSAEDRKVAAPLFTCAVEGYVARKDRVRAYEVLQTMREHVRGDDPRVIRAYAAVMKDNVPVRPWRMVEPAEADALRARGSGLVIGGTR
jgi:hypothetical protein